jgi:hypothetical protein
MTTQTPTTKAPSVWSKIEAPQTVDDLPNFPVLGKKEESPLKDRSANLKRPSKVKGVTFIVAPSRIVELKRARLNQAFPEIASDPTRFNHTKPCKNIEKTDGETYGVCTRDVCTYAHSLQEYKVPRCVFGDKCYRRDQAGDRACAYMHPKENLDSYCDRTGKSKPDLPESSESTRRPEPRKIVPVVPVPTPKDSVQKTPTVVPVPTPKDSVQKTPPLAATPAQKIPALVRTTPLPQVKTVTTVIRVPKEMFANAMEYAIKLGLQDFKIVIE